MVPHLDPEALLWTRRPQSEESWQRVTDYLVARLGHYLQLPVISEPPSMLGKRALACGLRGARPVGGVLQVEWSGVLTLEVHDEEQLLVHASLVMFSRRRRLQLTGHIGSSLELVFERGADGRGHWTALGWQEDIYGQHEDAEL
ncbi:MAG: hypothetical protein IPI49_17560 [Myxococcales bacterium]|nr:hypothetical protein [Myxococcales bacterium]HRC56864.1 hypothetical protein [Kofleriaceae bacterium]